MPCALMPAQKGEGGASLGPWLCHARSCLPHPAHWQSGTVGLASSRIDCLTVVLVKDMVVNVKQVTAKVTTEGKQDGEGG
jgi:hypothetical protein